MYSILFNVRKAQPTLYSPIHSTNVCPSNVTSNNDDERTAKNGNVSASEEVKKKLQALYLKLAL